MIQQTIKLIASAEPTPLFQTEQAYQDFRDRFQQEVTPELDRQREARRQSEEAAKQHLVY